MKCWHPLVRHCFDMTIATDAISFFLSDREREEQIQKLSEVQKQQAQQAEHALEDFKSQVERNSGRMFDEMKAQVQLSLTPINIQLRCNVFVTVALVQLA